MKKADKETLNAHLGTLEGMLEHVQTIQQEQQDAFDGKSEAWQEGDKGQALQSIIEALDQAAGSLQDSIDNLQSATAEE